MLITQSNLFVNQPKLNASVNLHVVVHVQLRVQFFNIQYRLIELLIAHLFKLVSRAIY